GVLLVWSPSFAQRALRISLLPIEVARAISDPCRDRHQQAGLRR
ncbi:MAG: hypothetical protein RIS46_846, partial [Actinomycetota bacterium]